MTTIVYTYTDEAPALATRALYPVFQRFLKPLGIKMEISDISVAGRILSQFPERLTVEQKHYAVDQLARLGDLCTTPDANIIKLPNISASVPQLNAAILELQQKGFNIPSYPSEPKTDEEKDFHTRYGKVLGSAVNPVLREGNSDRRVAAPVKAYAQKNPHRLAKWAGDCPTHVSHMTEGDFFESEKSTVVAADTVAKVEHVAADGSVTVLKSGLKLSGGDILDAAVLSVGALSSFYEREIADAKAKGILFSLHLKATMMKVSDPIMFGHCIRAFFKDVFAKYGDALKAAGANPRLGLGAVLDKVAAIADDALRAEIQAAFAAGLASGPDLAMVDSEKGITNLHVPSDVIIDASMPCVVRDGGCMWNKANKLQPVKCTIPDRCYATIYQEIIDFVKANGQFDVRTMGNVPNVGLMAQKAEEYGSHDKTFEIHGDGVVRVVDASGTVLFDHAVAAGDIWRACITKDLPVRDWVKLAVSRARATGWPAVFWLDDLRGHDRVIKEKAVAYLKDHDTTGLDIRMLTPQAALRLSCERAKAGENTISVTGNVLRDYLTDLFPILELGTSAKMLSIVPLLAGGGMYETGAGGSAPKHVQQFVEEGHLRWDSLGEYLALAASLEDLGNKIDDARTKLAASTLSEAIAAVLDGCKSPERSVKQIDNRGTNYWLARFWADAIAKQDVSFKALAEALAAEEATITKDLLDVQGPAVDVGGYYLLDDAKADAAMRPSKTFNAIIDA